MHRRVNNLKREVSLWKSRFIDVAQGHISDARGLDDLIGSKF